MSQHTRVQTLVQYIQYILNKHCLRIHLQ